MLPYFMMMNAWITCNARRSNGWLGVSQAQYLE